MEQIAISIFSGLGVTGVGFFFMWMVLKKYFQQVDTFMSKFDTVRNAVGEIINTIKDFSIGLVELRSAQDLARVTGEKSSDEIFKTYDKLDRNIEKLIGSLGKINTTLDVLVIEQRNTFFGTIALKKGWLTKEQVDVILDEQKHSSR